MTAHELLRSIHDAGGRVSIADGCQLDVERVPKHLVPELRQMKAEITNHLLDQNFRRLVERFNLKPVPPERLKEIENGQPWRPVSASSSERTNQPHWRGSCYRWRELDEEAKPAKRSWVDGPLCPGCYGVWPGLQALAGHLLSCGMFNLSAMEEAETRIKRGLVIDDKLAARLQRYLELGLGPLRGLGKAASAGRTNEAEFC